MKRVTMAAILVAIAAAFAGGFWSQHQRAVTAETEAGRLRGQLAAANDRVKLGEVLGDLLRLSDAVSARNYGEAASLSSAFFDHAREESARTSSDDVKRALIDVLATRDQVTAAIVQTDPSLAEILRRHGLTLRRALGYAVRSSP